ncbi:hypothetical protein SI65_06937 [Aspergillus cristatus]|uniref:Transcription factor domain-containing protein n=1 Tax=Aspergillus cristatus TaxID=573508 RepID=A0A1E3B8H0_ASPCR|nr:hypothetical protein SI65_06937 [Aspergillus cristatus]
MDAVQCAYAASGAQENANGDTFMARSGLENVSAQNHLRGSYSLIASGPNDLEPGLMRAGFWNYLREDITVALMEKRNLMIELNDQQPPLLDGEGDSANYISYILGRVINSCLHKDGEPLDQREWDSLKEELDSWKTSLPSSFEPIITPGLHGDSRFPSVWNTSKWHTASLQYYHTAMTILCLAEPVPHAINTLQHIERMKSIEANLEYHAIQVCALAISSHSAPVWVNSFGPISFCGPWLRQPEMLEELAAELEKWGARTGWPVSSIVKSLIKASD